MKRILLAFLVLFLLPLHPAEATPVQGYLNWSVLMCKFADRPGEPRDRLFFEELFTPVGAGQRGLHDFIASQSRGRATTGGTVVKGWFTMPYTWQQSKEAPRAERIDQCVRTVRAAGYTPPPEHRIAVMLNAGDIDSGAYGTAFLLDAHGWNSAWAVHEAMHTLGVGHGFSDDLTLKRYDWSQPGEYDDHWDVMSVDHIHHSRWSDKFGQGAIGFNAPRLDEVGWLPQNRVLTAGKDGQVTTSVQLAPIERQDLPGTLMVRVPYDVKNLNR
ncbi:hypothetical protein ACIBG7_41590 [Nonomuraea sp. NPDC050328]|uniref:hypothetical protein n=1 Tax=Nonomuraea sp. NPDC050328 TaxID=3364361 RepID=UPI0037B62B79